MLIIVGRGPPPGKGSIPGTWVTVYTGDIGNTFAPSLAVRLGKLCGDGPDIWLRMQQVFDRENAERKLKHIIAKIPTLHAAE